jgi:nitric oxide reductase activation protein
MDGAVAQVSRVFQRELQDVRHQQRLKQRKGRQFDASRFWRLAQLGDTKVFKRAQVATGMDTAVHVLFDRSYSMRDDDKLQIALDAGFCCAQALERLNKIKVALGLFPGDDHYIDQYESLMPFGQKTRQIRSRLEGIEPKGGTPMAGGIDGAGAELMQMRVEKRLLLVITDGDPDDRADALDAIQRATALGIMVMGIGIGKDCNMPRLMADSQQISDVGELADALEQMFKTKMEAIA